ncbi:hypothetical protein NDU88_002620 [Pleurodeles waltl]|uniref:Uncharacterized protein n=1 Tax=Pleurodeles waltl TaxID=8319 RepID=A0AAV7REI7_PLEWA|nr:hypothetical protein NDU88_002620 [Pleurodeles waltl]
MKVGGRRLQILPGDSWGHDAGIKGGGRAQTHGSGGPKETAAVTAMVGSKEAGTVDTDKGRGLKIVDPGKEVSTL